MSTWVLLRGLAREARHWGSFPALLEQRLPPADDLVVLDLPGNGACWRETSPASVAGMVAAARAQLRSRSLSGPCVLVALSLGGMVALEWAARARAEVDGCVLINSSLGACSPFWQRLRPGCYGPLLRSLLPGSAWARERAIHGMTSTRAPDPELLRQWVCYARTRPVSAANVARQLLAAARFRAPAQLPAPTLVLSSLGDRLVSPECSRAIAGAWRLPLREHPWAGHDLPLDDPSWVVEQIASWYPEHFVRP
jgi:pimeloyl-ACP methyl ester carboxylesterase